MDGSFLDELASIKDNVTICHISWTRRSLDELNRFGHICVPENKACKFPSRLRLCGQTSFYCKELEQCRVQLRVINSIGSTWHNRVPAHLNAIYAASMLTKVFVKKSPRSFNFRGPHTSTDLTFSSLFSLVK